MKAGNQRSHGFIKVGFMLIIMFIIIALYLGAGPLIQAAQSSWHFKPSDVNKLHSRAADIRLSYGKDPLQFGELRLPVTSGKYPVIMIIHGGCWISKFADFHNTEALADALRANGYATWNIEYRGEDNKGGGWTGTFDDVGNAADFLRTIEKKYSLDLSRVIVIGHSAGGHLALWLAGRRQLSPSSPVYKRNPLSFIGVISLGGVPDLENFRKQGIQVCGSDVIVRLLGSSEDQAAKHYQEASPIELLPLGIPQSLIYGAEERVVPVQFSDAYVRKAKAMGESISVTTVDYAGHHEYIVPNSVTWPIIQSTIQKMMAVNKK